MWKSDGEWDDLDNDWVSIAIGIGAAGILLLAFLLSAGCGPVRSGKVDVRGSQGPALPSQEEPACVGDECGVPSPR